MRIVDNLNNHSNRGNYIGIETSNVLDIKINNMNNWNNNNINRIINNHHRTNNNINIIIPDYVLEPLGEHEYDFRLGLFFSVYCPAKSFSDA